MKPTILVNLKRCSGCWTCSMACKVAHGLQAEEFWQFVRTIGSASGIDEPGGVYPNNHMSWMPVYTDKCMLCAEREAIGTQPYCVYNCPTKALTYGALDDQDREVTLRLEQLRQSGYKVFQLPPWERSRPEIIYVEQ